MAFSYTYDLATSIGRVRLYASDTAVGATSDVRGLAIYANEEIQVFLDNNFGDPLSAAADALYALAANKSRLAQHAQMGDGVEQDLTKLAATIIQAADKLNEQANNTPASATQGITRDDFSYRREYENTILKQGGST